MLIINVLHLSAVGAGFIPVLPTAGKIQKKYNAAGRTGINPAPTAVECCNYCGRLPPLRRLSAATTVA